MMSKPRIWKQREFSTSSG